MAQYPTKQPGVITKGLCIVADELSAHEAYELAHHRSHIENIKVRPKSYLTGAGDDLDVLRHGDFHVICDGKFDFTRIDEARDTLGLFVRSGTMPDAVTYSRAVGERVMCELVELMFSEDIDVDPKDQPRPHTIVLTGYLPEQRIETADRLDVLGERILLADKLQKLGASVAVYGAIPDLASVDTIPDGVITIGAGVRNEIDVTWGYITYEQAMESSVDILLIGSVMGNTQVARTTFLDEIAPLCDKDDNI